MLQFLHIGFYIKSKETKQVPRKEMQKEIVGASFFPTQLVSPHITLKIIQFIWFPCAFISNLLWSLNKGGGFFKINIGKLSR